MVEERVARHHVDVTVQLLGEVVRFNLSPPPVARSLEPTLGLDVDAMHN